MAIAFKRIAVYLRVALMVVVGLLILIVVFKNWKHDTDVWLFRPFQGVNVVWVMLISGGVSVAAFWVFSRVRGVIRDLRQIQAERHEARARQENEQLARKLAQQEERIDEKIQRALNEKKPSEE